MARSRNGAHMSRCSELILLFGLSFLLRERSARWGSLVLDLGSGRCLVPSFGTTVSHFTHLSRHQGQRDALRTVFNAGELPADRVRKHADQLNSCSSPAAFMKLFAGIYGQDCGMLWKEDMKKARRPKDFIRGCLDELVATQPPSAMRLVGMLARYSKGKSDAEQRRSALAAVLKLTQTSSEEMLFALQGWNITERDATLEQLGAVQLVSHDFSAAGDWDGAVSIAERFPKAAAEMCGDDVDDVVEYLAEQSQASLALRLCDALGRKEQVRQLRRAARRERIVDGIRKNKLMQAVMIAGRKPADQPFCIDALLAEGMVDLALECADTWGLDPPQLSEEVRQLHAERSASHFRMPDSATIETLDAEEQLSEAFSELSRAPVLGWDTESTARGKLAWLQLSNGQKTYLVDLMALGKSAKLGNLLVDLLAKRSIKNLVFGGGSKEITGMGVLPGLEALKSAPVERVIDLRMWAARARAAKSGEQHQQAKEGLSLSALTKDVLGKPLDKSMQAGDWTRRPLLTAQAEYAALDAFVLVVIYERLRSQ